VNSQVWLPLRRLLQIGPAGHLVAQRVCERLRDGDRFLAKRDPQVVFGGRDSRCRQGRDLGQGLTVQEQKDSGDTVSQRFAIAVEALAAMPDAAAG